MKVTLVVCQPELVAHGILKCCYRAIGHLHTCGQEGFLQIYVDRTKSEAVKFIYLFSEQFLSTSVYQGSMLDTGRPKRQEVPFSKSYHVMQ